MLILCR